MNDTVSNFQNQIRQFETAISSYRGNDPLDLWYRYICWLEQNSNNDVENIFRKSVEHCLSLYEKYENYKQDIRMVKLWIKYIDFQPNPLNLYQILYQQGIGTSHSCFYIAWAHYFNTANALKQAESIYNLGKQLKAQPIEELETAQKNFRFSVAQRMLYNDSSSKKRTISSLAEQRQQITALSPHQGPQQSKRTRYDEYEYSPNRYQEQPQQNQQIQQPQQHSVPVASYNNYNNNNSHPQSEVHQFPKQEQQQTVEPQQSSSQQNYYENPQNSSDAGYVISSSLNYVYNQTAENGYTEEPVQQPNPVKEEEVPEVTRKFVYEDGIQLPQNFVRHVKNNTDQWNGPLCLEEPYDQNRKCFYPKHIVYPGDGSEYSLEEVLSRKWFKRIEENRQMEEEAKRKRQEELERQEQQQRYMAEMARKQREEEERAKYEMEMYQRQQQQQQYNQYQHNQNYHYQYNQHHQMKSYDYHYHESNSQYYHPQQPVPPHPQHPDNMYHQNQYQHQHQYPQQHYQHPHPHMVAQHQPHHPQNHPHQNMQQISQQSQQSVIVNTKQYHEQQGHYPHQMQYSQPPQPQAQPVAEVNQNQYPQNFDQYYNGNPQPILAQKVEVFEEPQPEDDEYESEYERDEEDENEEEETESSETDQFQTPLKVQKKKNDVTGMGDDLEEQIEASTISFCSTATNGISTQKKITIKFRKEKPPKSLENTSASSSPGAGNSNVPYPTTQKTKKRKPAQYTMLTSYDNENTTFMPSNNNSCSERPTNAVDDAELLLSFSSNHKTHSNDSTINSEFNRSFGNISFSTQDKTLTNNQFGTTPIKHSSSISKTSTPINSYKFLKKHESNISLQNDDSLCSFTADQNSFFQAENDEELQKSRLEKALKTVEEHLKRRDIDPFSSELCKALLIKLNFPNRQNTTDYKIINNNLPKLFKNQMASLGGCSYQIEKEVGRGSYGAVYRGVNTFDGSVVALKYQKPPNSWELYICTEVKNRLKNSDILPGFMSISSAVIAPNASVLISEFSQYGSLLDINNRIRQATTKVMHESLVMHFSSEILNVCDYLHSCNIIHADIKPDNFLLMSIPSVESNVPSLRLIDFGCAIDMNLFEKGTEFRKIIQTDGFTCTEMLQGKPWSFQTDMFCVAGTIHVMLFGEYMQVVKKAESNWEIKQKFPRYLKKHVWSDIFAKLLNIKDKNHLPNLQDMRKVLNRELMGMENELIKNIRTLSNLLKKR